MAPCPVAYLNLVEMVLKENILRKHRDHLVTRIYDKISSPRETGKICQLCCAMLMGSAGIVHRGSSDRASRARTLGGPDRARRFPSEPCPSRVVGSNPR